MKCNALACEEELRRFPFVYIESVKSSEGRVLGSNRETHDAFRAHFHDHFPHLPVEEFRSYIAGFLRFREAEAASFEGLVTEYDVRDALKQVGLYKSPGQEGLPYEEYIRLLHMFVRILTDILPRKTCELTFTESLELQIELFSRKTSLFHKRWKCLNLTCKEGDDLTTFTSIVIKHSDNFRLEELSADNFKCLIFMQRLLSIKDAEIKRRIRNKLENEPNITLQEIVEDFQMYDSVKQYSKINEESSIARIIKIRYNMKQSKSPTKINESKQSLHRKVMNQKTGKSIWPLTNVLNVELYTGTKIVLSGIRNVLCVTELDIKAHIADLKTK